MPGAYIHEPDSDTEHSDSSDESLVAEKAASELKPSTTTMQPMCDSDVDASEQGLIINQTHGAPTSSTSSHQPPPVTQQTTEETTSSREAQAAWTVGDQDYPAYMSYQVHFGATSFAHPFFDFSDFQQLEPAITNATPPPLAGFSRFGTPPSKLQTGPLFTAAGERQGLFGSRFTGAFPPQATDHANVGTLGTKPGHNLFEPIAKATEHPAGRDLDHVGPKQAQSTSHVGVSGSCCGYAK